MKKIIMMIVLGSSLAQAAPLVCESIDHTDRCNDEVTRIKLDFDSNTFTYDSSYRMKLGAGCGWPPVGFMIEGTLQQSDEQSYSLVSPDIGTVKYDGQTLLYISRPGHELELECGMASFPSLPWQE